VVPSNSMGCYAPMPSLLARSTQRGGRLGARLACGWNKRRLAAAFPYQATYGVACRRCCMRAGAYRLLTNSVMPVDGNYFRRMPASPSRRTRLGRDSFRATQRAARLYAAGLACSGSMCSTTQHHFHTKHQPTLTQAAFAHRHRVGMLIMNAFLTLVLTGPAAGMWRVRR